jgi:hypothetical protein
MVKRGLVTFYYSKLWTKQAAAREAGTRRLWLLSALRAHTKPPYKTDLLWEALRALNCPGQARTADG